MTFVCIPIAAEFSAAKREEPEKEEEQFRGGKERINAYLGRAWEWAGGGGGRGEGGGEEKDLGGLLLSSLNPLESASAHLVTAEEEGKEVRLILFAQKIR